jgi:hypothetical protein
VILGIGNNSHRHQGNRLRMRQKVLMLPRVQVLQ